MNIDLASRPRKLKSISTPGLKGMEYEAQLGLCQALERTHPRFVDYLLKPATDEMWNMIDGERSIADIINYALFEFDLDSDPAIWLEVFAGWKRAGLVELRSD